MKESISKKLDRAFSLLGKSFLVIVFVSLAAFAPRAEAADGEINVAGINTNLTGDDVAAGPFNLGFTFSFFGTNYTQAYVNINGTITFGSSFAQYSNGPLSGAGADNTIYAFWDDLNTNKSGTSGNKPIYYATAGEAPNRKFIVQWTDIYFHGTTVQLGTFQVVLYEGSNEIRLQYRDLLGGARALGNSATVGIKKNASTYKQYSNDTASLIQGQSIQLTPNGSNDYTMNASSTYDLIYILPTGAPVSPTLVNPTNGTLGATLRPTFEWLQVASATSYTLLVSTQSDFSSTVVNASNVSGTSYTLGSDLSQNTNYYWRVQSVNSFGGSLSSTRTFTTGSANTAPSSPASLSSATFLGGASSGTVAGGTLSMTLEDPDASEQVRYRLQVARDNAFSNLVLDYRSQFAAEGNATYTFGENSGTYLVGAATTTLAAGDYYVRVRTEDDAAASSNWVSSGSVDFSLVADTGAPIISSLSVSTLTASSATIAWDTNEAASSMVEYGPSSAFGTTTPVSNVSPGVLSHSVDIQELHPCVTYHYRVYSDDAASNRATSSAASFTTKGCTAEALVLTQSQSTGISTSTGGTVDLLQSGRGVSLSVPSSFSASSSGTVYFQIKRIQDDTVANAVGAPSSQFSPVSGHTYALNAITEGMAPVTEFDEPISITISYSPADMQGIDESTLVIYRWGGSSWNALSNCSVDATAKTVTCFTDHFSTFTLFGTPVSSGSSSTGVTTSAAQGSVIAHSAIQHGCKDQAASNYNYFSSHKQELCLYAAASGAASAGSGSTTQASVPVASEAASYPASHFSFERNLHVGAKGPDVKALQVYLNSRGFAVSDSGAGSAGNETDMFGSKTRTTLIRFQKANGISPAVGFFGPVTRAFVTK
ncbi:MAG TPA: fibronectin type III domain-containing protein [Candidatus Paceibacterota bacterium]